MKIITNFLFYALLVVPLGTFANAIFGSSPNNLHSLAINNGMVYGIPSIIDLDIKTNSLRSEIKTSTRFASLNPTEAPCNEYSKWINADYSNLTVSRKGGIPKFDNTERIIDNNLDNYSRLGAILYANSWIEVKDNNATGVNAYIAGTYAGFVINDIDLLSIGGSLKIETYLGNNKQETYSDDNLIKSFLDSGKKRFGFVTSKSFDRVRLVVKTGLTIAINVDVYYVQILKPCTSSSLECNTATALVQADRANNKPGHAVIVETSRSGLEGGAIGSFQNAERVVDQNTDSYMTMSINIGVLASASISVRDLDEIFPSGNFAGFNISNSNFLALNLLGSSTVRTYLKGVLRETSVASGSLIAVPLFDGTGRYNVGFVTTKTFDEIRYTINQPVGVGFGDTHIYHLVGNKFCPSPPVICQTSTSLVNPDYAVVLENSRTGIDGGVACVGCSVSGLGNVTNQSVDDSAIINLSLGAIGASGSISVRDMSTTYPTGTLAGFVVRDTNPIFQIGLLSGIQIRTYLNGNLQESRLGSGQLIDLNVLLPWLGSNSQKRAIGFVTTKPFNEVRITYTTLLQLLSYLEVYHAFVDGRYTAGCENLVSLNARNDINITPVNVSVDGNVLTNDIGENLFVSDATYRGADGISQSLTLGDPTEIYDVLDHLAGVIAMNPDGNYQFMPEANYTGEVTIGYTAKDGNGVMDTANLTIKVIPTYIPYQKNPPIAVNDNLITDKNVSVTGDVIFNDTDLDGDDLSVTNINIGGTSYPVNPGPGTFVTIPSVGNFNINEDGIFTFVPALDFTGDVPTITYTIIDGNDGDATADLNIKVIDRLGGENSTYANDDVNSALQGDNLYGKILENDFDPQGDNQKVKGASLHADGDDYILSFGSTVTITGVGAFTLNSDGSYYFAPDGNFVGTVEMAYEIEDENNNGRPDYGEVATSSATLYLTIFARIRGVCISSKVLLQGALVDVVDSSIYVSDDIMRDDIRAKGLLPLTQPYNDAIYNYEGTETVDPSVFGVTGNNAIVDWVLLELRDATDPSIIVARRAALLQRDGDIVTVDGTSCVLFEYYSGNYYLAIRHRNHFGTMSALALDMTQDLSFNFTTEALYVIAGRKEAPVFTRNGFQMLWGGDVNADGNIVYRGVASDFTEIESFILNNPGNIFKASSYLTSGYLPLDVNMDGSIGAYGSGNDSNLIQSNILQNSAGNLFLADAYTLFLQNLP